MLLRQKVVLSVVRLYNQKSVKTIGSKVIRHHFLTNLPIYLPTSVNNAGSPDNRSELEQKFAIYFSFLYIFWCIWQYKLYQSVNICIHILMVPLKQLRRKITQLVSWIHEHLMSHHQLLTMNFSLFIQIGLAILYTQSLRLVPSWWITIIV